MRQAVIYTGIAGFMVRNQHKITMFPNSCLTRSRKQIYCVYGLIILFFNISIPHFQHSSAKVRLFDPRKPLGRSHQTCHQLKHLCRPPRIAIGVGRGGGRNCAKYSHDQSRAHRTPPPGCRQTS